MRLFAGPAVAAFACVAGPGALAQQSTAYEQAAIAAASACFAAAPTDNAAAAVSACSTLLTSMSDLRTSFAPLSGHDQNVDLVVRTMATTRVGRAYSILDGGVRSARVCTEMEKSWALISQMNPAASPQYTETMASLRDTQVDVVRKCRNEQGVPAGAVPLPS